LAESPENNGVMTPVPTVAMDGGLLESRLDRLKCLEPQGRLPVRLERLSRMAGAARLARRFD